MKGKTDMDPVSKFNEERHSSIASYAEDQEFRSLSRQWVELSMERRYVYNFDWLGRPIIQYPQDMVALQEIVWKTRPDIIVETGIAHGGSLVLHASLLSLLDIADAAASKQHVDPFSDRRKVIGVDIDIRAHNRAAISSHPLSHKITMIEGSSIDGRIVERVKAEIAPGKRVMVCLDSMHTHNHVLSELRSYGPLVSPACYCVVFDSFIEDLPVDFFADRPWNVGNSPKTAIRQYLSEQSCFEVDDVIHQKLLVTAAPGGYLRRKTERTD